MSTVIESNLFEYQALALDGRLGPVCFIPADGWEAVGGGITFRLNDTGGRA